MQNPVAWMLKTGHGVMFAVGKPSSEIDLWTPLYVEPPASLPDRGPWKIVNADQIGSDDFTHDVWLKVSGDFGGDEPRAAYMQWLCSVLNAEPPAPRERHPDDFLHFREPPAPREPTPDVATIAAWLETPEGRDKIAEAVRQASEANAQMAESRRVTWEMLNTPIGAAAPSEIARDAARLDWIDANVKITERVKGWTSERWRWSLALPAADNIRAAIDAAIEQERNA
jgi:hypothetical protein